MNEQIDDLSALAWVQEELRRSLDAAHKSLRRHVKESEALSGSDVDAVDPGVLRQARAQLHQGVGALELVGLPSAATLLRATESAVSKLSGRPRRLNAAAVDAIEHASFALLDYLQRMLAGKPVSPLALFPQYRAVQELAGADRVHPADLWPLDWRWRDVPADASATPRRADAATRSAVETQTLALMRPPPASQAAAAAQLSELFAGLGGAAGTGDHRLTTLWRLAAAFFESQAQGLLKPDIYSKRIASRLLAQLRLGERGEADASAGVSDRLAQDLLFFCAQAEQPGAGRAAPRLAAVRQAWKLSGAAPQDYESSRLGRFDPAWIAQARKRVAGAKEAWSAVAGGELHRLSGLAEQFSLVGDSIKRLYDSGDRLAEALQDAIVQTVDSGDAPAPALAMEVATAVLYLDASLEDADFEHPDEGARVQRLAQRINGLRQGQSAEPLEAWMEELYRRVSDRQTMGSVVQELRASLLETEKAIDQYFRDPSRRELLIPVPGQLQAMRGVLSVLGMDQASQAVLRMRDEIDAMAQTEVDPVHAAQSGTFDRLAGNLGALGFLIDMLSVQPQVAKSLFVFDAETGSLRSVVGGGQHRAAQIGHPTEAEAAPAEAAADAGLVEHAQSLALAAAHPEVSVEDVSRDLARLSEEALVADQPELAETANTAHAALERADDDAARQAVREELAQVMADFVATQSGAESLDGLEPAMARTAPRPLHPAPVLAAEIASGETGLEEDAEMREIFLEEAREVLDNAGAALDLLKTTPADLGELTNLRRAFHTLKGSSRMVGLTEFGEAGWACEQLYNARLADAPRADEALLGFTTDALAYLGAWVDDIAAGRRGGHTAAPVRAAADALRLDGRRLALTLTDEAQAPVIEAPSAAAEAPASPPMPSVVDSAHGELMPLPQEDAAAVADPVFDRLSLDLDLDLAGTSAEQSPETTPVLSTDDWPLDADTEAIETPALEPDLAMPVAELVEAAPELDFDFSLNDAAPAEPVAEAVTAEAPETPEAETVAAAETAETEGAMEPPSTADQFRHVGPLAVPIPLFNIYLNEADEQSRRLSVELAEWALELHRPVGETAIALAHSLAGNSATVGFSDLSHLARALEHALMRSQALGIGQPDEAVLFTDAAEEIRRLLHQFAAGFLQTVPPELMERLAAHEVAAGERLHTMAAELDLPRGTGTVNGDFDDLPLEPLTLDLDLEPSAAADAPVEQPAIDELPLIEVAEAAPAPVAERLPEAAVADQVADEVASAEAKPVAAEAETEAIVVPLVPAVRPVPGLADRLPVELKAFTALPAGERQSVSARADALDDEDIDVEDAVDAELFPIFEEEAEELLPQLATRLRDWARRPGDPSGAASCMRTLHTLKGGARLAGAMRLGELAHRLETAIEHLLSRGDAGQAEVEALQGRADALNANFEALKAGDAVPATPVAVQEAPPAAAPAVAPALRLVQSAPEPEADTPTEAPPEAATAAAVTGPIDWSRFSTAVSQPRAVERSGPNASQAAVRVRAPLLDRLVNHAGEVSITRSRIESDVNQLKASLGDLTDNLERLRSQLHDIEIQAETQISSRIEAAKAASQNFDPLEMDRFTRFQELTRMMAESVNDVATVQRSLQRTLQSAEDELAAQARLTRDLQDDLLRTRMVEFEGLSDRLYRVVRQAAKETGKQVRLDIVGGSLEVDRGVLDRMTGAFEHLLRNCVTHGIETPEVRQSLGKEAAGQITVALTHEGNEVGVEFRDDGGGLNLARIRERGLAMGLIDAGAEPGDVELANLIFTAGFSTAEQITELAGRGVGMDVVRNEIVAMGGRIETSTAAGQGTSFRLVLPLTTAVTQVVMLRAGETTVAVPSTLVETVLRATPADVAQAYASGQYTVGDSSVPFFWLGALLQSSPRGTGTGRTLPIVVIRSAQQRVALHVDEVLGNQEVVVKNLGAQMARMPGLAGMTLLASGAPALIYNPVALAALYGESARAAMREAALAPETPQTPQPAVSQAPLVLVVDDSLTVRRVTQRLLVREGYRVSLAKDGLEGLERLAEELPAVVLSDIEMPRMDGFDLVRNMRGDARLRSLPVIMITSRIAQKHRDHAAQLGVDHYLGKPYAEEDLLALVARYVAAPATAA